MDQKKFDALVQKLTADSSRRGIVRGAVSGAVGSALAAVGIQSADAKKDKGKDKKKDGKKADGQGKKGKAGDQAAGGPDVENCIANGKRCGKGDELRPCRQCCSGRTIKKNGTRRCACRPDGTDCGNSAQCCSGQCSGGFCGPLS